jgi:hypothetical protein
MNADLKPNEPHRLRRKKQADFYYQPMLHDTFRRQAHPRLFICENL